VIKHFVVVGVLVAGVAALLYFLIGGVDTLLPTQASEEARFVDRLFGIHFILIVSIFALIVVFMLYSVVVFRRKPGDESDGTYFKGHTRLEVLWTVIPLGIVLTLATVGAQVLGKIEKVEADEMLVRVSGFQWDWRFEYPEYGTSSAELYLPVDRQARFEMSSVDVIHSFWVPEFRIKQDLVPGLTTTLRIKPTQIGDYTLRCAELCGAQHYKMEKTVHVMAQTDFDAWVQAEIAAAGVLTPIELGAKVAKEQGCASCHSLDGSKLVGPSWLGVYGSEEKLSDGSTVIVDDAYIRNSIIDPNAQIVAGYPANVMAQDYETRLKPEEIDALIAYIKSLSE